MKNLFLAFSMFLSFGFLSLNANALADVVTIEGTIVKVVPQKKEIYVQATDKKHEFYFKENTELLQNGQKADFSVLKVDQKVKVEAAKVGKRLDPVKVEILN